MSDSDRNDSRTPDTLTSALHELAHSSPQSASPATAAALVNAFHRHHRQRRVKRQALVLTITLAIAGGSFWLRLALKEKPRANQTDASTSSSIAATAITKDDFVALPSFALVSPGEDFRVIRVEMPVSSLLLLGARVNDEMSTHHIVADLLVGNDGTPYAFRIVT